MLIGSTAAVLRADELATTRPAQELANLPHLKIEFAEQQVRMECESVLAEGPLEYLVCASGTAEHETVLRSAAKPSHLHLALLMIGLDPGEPLRVSADRQQRIAPSGRALKLSCEFERDGQVHSVPAYELMLSQRSGDPLKPMTWVFVGSRLTEDGQYAADITGRLVSVVNFQHTVIDLPELRSDRNDSLEWVVNANAAPPRGSTVWLVIEPAEKDPKGERDE